MICNVIYSWVLIFQYLIFQTQSYHQPHLPSLAFPYSPHTTTTVATLADILQSSVVTVLSGLFIGMLGQVCRPVSRVFLCHQGHTHMDLEATRPHSMVFGGPVIWERASASLLEQNHVTLFSFYAETNSLFCLMIFVIKFTFIYF